jgi:hypothetical protein
MKSPHCCNQNCNQGADCPNRRAAPPTAREWAFVVILLVFGLVLSCLR